MNKIRAFFDGLRNFVGEVKSELKKSSWPTRPELFESTIVVLVSVVILGVFVGASDLVLMQLMKLVIR